MALSDHGNETATALHHRQGCVGREDGERVWDPKVCVPKMAQSHVPDCNGAGSYSVAVGLCPSELTGTGGWILPRITAKGKGCPRDVLEEGEGEVWDPKVRVPKMPKSIFRFINCIFSHDETGSGGEGRGSSAPPPPPPPMVVSRSNTSLTTGQCAMIAHLHTLHGQALGKSNHSTLRHQLGTRAAVPQFQGHWVKNRLIEYAGWHFRAHVPVHLWRRTSSARG